MHHCDISREMASKELVQMQIGRHVYSVQYSTQPVLAYLALG
eukprot:COSAG03_NODE_17828_length_367_cov_0.750000_1_plen_41_part_10